MSIHFQMSVTGDDADHAIEEFRKVFGALVGALPTVTGGAIAGAQCDFNTHRQYPQAEEPQVGGEVIPPVKKTRKAKDKAPEVIDNTPLADASSAEKAESVSTSSTTETSSTSASGVSSVSIDDLRAKLMALSKTDGGHDTVFGILGKFGAKNASTVPEDKRGEVVALVDLALEVA